jgi:hypothetical protein
MMTVTTTDVLMPGLNPYVRQPARSRSTSYGTLTSEVTGVNHYGAKARDHWRKHLPGHLAQIRDQEAFFTQLGEAAATEIDQIADALVQAKPPGGGYMQELGRLETARKTAEMQVTREMLLVDPEDQERIAQLLG